MTSRGKRITVSLFFRYEEMIITNFKNWILLNRGFAKNTANNYERSIVKFDEYLKELTFGRGVEECEMITLNHIHFFIKHLRQKGLAMRTCNNYIAGIRCFLKYCFVSDRDVIEYKKVLFGKEVRKKIGFLKDEECEAMFTTLREDMTLDDLTKARNFCILSLLLHTGLRVSELNSLKVSDIESEVQIIGKGGELRTVALFNTHIEHLRYYIHLRKLRKIKSDWMFISHANNSRGGKLSRNSIEDIVKAIAQKAGIDRNVYPHLFRHTFATKIVRKGGNIYYVQKLLGHKHITTTQLYLDALASDLEATQKLAME